MYFTDFIVKTLISFSNIGKNYLFPIADLFSQKKIAFWLLSITIQIMNEIQYSKTEIRVRDIV